MNNPTASVLAVGFHSDGAEGGSGRDRLSHHSVTVRLASAPLANAGRKDSFARLGQVCEISPADFGYSPGDERWA